MASLNPSRMLLYLFWFSFIPILENGYVESMNPCLSCKRCKGCSRSCLDCPNCDEHFKITRSCAIAMAIGAGVGVIGVWLAPVLLAILGFTAAGVTAGSLAALWQSTMAGVVAQGGIFAILQSIGAAGFSYSGYVIVAGAAGAAMCKFCEQLGSVANMDMKCYSQINCDYYSDY